MSDVRDRKPKKNILGRRFGKLVVTEWAGESRWICACDCGNTTKVLTANLTRANTRSCGCIRRAVSSKRNTTHGLSNTKAYKTWCSVKRRCYDKKCRSYEQYGARGVTMYGPWINDPAAFIAYIGEAPSGNYTLDRIDNSKGYEPGNIRWATPTAQANNKTNNKFVVYRGARMTLSQLARAVAEEVGIRPQQFLDAFRSVAGKS